MISINGHTIDDGACFNSSANAYHPYTETRPKFGSFLLGTVLALRDVDHLSVQRTSSKYLKIGFGQPLYLLKAVWSGAYEGPHSLSPKTSESNTADLRHSSVLQV